MADERLPPFPDELLDPLRKLDVITWLNGWQLPSRYAAFYLGRWAAYVGVTLDRSDYARVRRDLPPAREG